MRFLAKSLLVLIFLFAIPALAQVEPSARVGRVSLVSGTLAFYGPGDTDWSAAKVNLPVAVGAWLATDPQSHAGMRVGTDSIDLSNDTQLNFAELRDRVMQIALTHGRIDLHLRSLEKDETAEIDVMRGGVWLLQPGVYDIDTGGPDQPTRITVFEGSARFAGRGIDTVVDAGQVLVLSGSDTLSAAVERAAPDEFVRWCRSHDYDEKRLAASHHVSAATTGYEELDSYGEWAAVPTYGEVWFPKSVSGGWAPYREGRWVWIEPWGWHWVDDEPWGFAPFHYGRWARVDARWAWVPGEFAPEPVYAPALVAFIPPPAIAVSVLVPIDAGQPVGWFPLAPDEVYWPAYTRDQTYIRNVNITNVNITKINTIIAAQPATADPPPQVINQQFANRAAATVVPARVLVESGRVAPAAVAVPPQVLQQAAVSIRPPPVVARPAAPAPTPLAAPPSPARHETPPAPSGAMALIQRAPSTAAQSKPTAAAAAHSPARPNFAQLAPAPRVSQTLEAPQKSPQTPPSAQAITPETHPPLAPTAPAPQPSANATLPAAPPSHRPGAPDFLHLAPVRTGPPASPHPAQPPVQAVPGTSLPAARASASETAQPAPEMPGPPAPTPTPSAGPPPGPPDFSHLPTMRHSPQPPLPAVQATSAPPRKTGTAPEAIHQPAPAEPAPASPIAHVPPRSNAGGAPSPAPDNAAQQRASAEAAARQRAIAAQQAQQRAAAEAAARQQPAQQGQQRAPAEAAAQQRAIAAQQAQQRAAAEAAARQQPAQQGQQRAPAEAAAQQRAIAAQQAEQRAAAARQQAAQQGQQRAASAAQQQHAEACGHPGQPPCSK
jgi:hypothetical protein